MFARKLISRNPFQKHLMFFSVGLLQTVCSIINDFIALEITESVLTSHDDNFHVMYACTVDACALDTRRRFLTERGKEKKTEPKFKPRPHCLGKKPSYFVDDLRSLRVAQPIRLQHLHYFTRILQIQHTL